LSSFSFELLALGAITQDACAFYEDHTLLADFTEVVYETSEGERIAQSLGQHKAAILRNHGLITVGHCVEEAAWWFIAMDRSCQARLLAEAAGVPVKIDHATAVATREQVGNHLADGSSFNRCSRVSSARSLICSSSFLKQDFSMSQPVAETIRRSFPNSRQRDLAAWSDDKFR
jgi:hypothetical protein